MISLRPAIDDDRECLWLWRNDPLTRAMSLTEDEVDWADHCAWFARLRSDPDRHLLIGERAGVAVGTVRLDRAGDSAEIHITVAPESRRRGVGLALLRAATAFAADLGLVGLTAVIRPDNPASQVIFRRAGYQHQRDDEAVGHYRLSIA